MKPLSRPSDFPPACHKAALPRMLNDYKWQRAMSPYDEWQTSSCAKQSPLPFYKKETFSTCQTCHMPREQLTGVDYGAKQNQLASHRWLGANTAIPKIYKFDEQAKRVVAFLQNNVFNMDIFAIQTREPDAAGGATAQSQPNLIAPLAADPLERTARHPVT